MGNREGLLGRCCGNKHPGICCSHVATWFLKSPHEQQYNREDQQEVGRYLMRFVSTILALTLLAFCQSASAETVYYCVTGAWSQVLPYDPEQQMGGNVITGEKPQRFVLKVDKDTMRFEGSDPWGPRKYNVVYKIAHYHDDQKWWATGTTERPALLDNPSLTKALWTVFFRFPDYVASTTGYNGASKYVAKCETF